MKKLRKLDRKERMSIVMIACILFIVVSTFYVMLGSAADAISYGAAAINEELEIAHYFEELGDDRSLIYALQHRIDINALLIFMSLIGVVCLLGLFVALEIVAGLSKALYNGLFETNTLEDRIKVLEAAAHGRDKKE